MKKLLTGLSCAAIILLTSACASQTGRTAPKTATLENTRWVLSSVADRIYNPPADTRPVSIHLNGQRLSGYLGCNSLAGGYVLTGVDGIRFSTASTRMACLGEGMAYENRLQRALSGADRYQIDRDKLALYQGQTLLAVFIARP